MIIKITERLILLYSLLTICYKYNHHKLWNTEVNAEIDICMEDIWREVLSEC